MVFFCREIGELAGVPIEPDSHSEVLNQTMNIDGVLICGVPGIYILFDNFY